MCCFAISAIPSGCLKLVSGDSHFSSTSLIKNIRCVCCYFANVSYYLCKMELNLITFGLIPCVLGTAVIGSGIILGRASDPLILELQSYTLMLFFKFVSKKKKKACTALQTSPARFCSTKGIYHERSTINISHPLHGKVKYSPDCEAWRCALWGNAAYQRN